MKILTKANVKNYLINSNQNFTCEKLQYLTGAHLLLLHITLYSNCTLNIMTKTLPTTLKVKDKIGLPVA